MSDLFDKQVPDEWRERVIEVMRDAPHLPYQILTKRPKGNG
jgi:protein gp37